MHGLLPLVLGSMDPAKTGKTPFLLPQYPFCVPHCILILRAYDFLILLVNHGLSLQKKGLMFFVKQNTGGRVTHL